MITLVIGGARSGKSRFAQSLASPASRVAYIATARAEDEEMRRRITCHRESRPTQWATVEEPLEISLGVSRCAKNYETILLDCLTTWLSNLCWERQEKAVSELEAEALEEIDRLVAAARPTHLVVVTNEVGSGIVPESPIGRVFRDLQGWVNQRMAQRADNVFYLVAGLPSLLKGAEERDALGFGLDKSTQE